MTLTCIKTIMTSTDFTYPNININEGLFSAKFNAILEHLEGIIKSTEVIVGKMWREKIFLPQTRETKLYT